MSAHQGSNHVPSVAVVIPTIGKETVLKAIDSVYEQSYPDIKIHLVIDGPEYVEVVRSLNPHIFKDQFIAVTQLGENVGAAPGGPFYGHRVYAASPHITNADYVFFLDEDNWYKPNHVASLVELCERHRLDWAFSFRSVYADDEFVCDDRCESLGFWPVWNGQFNGIHYHVDTSTYCFRRTFLIGTSFVWHWGYAADRRFFGAINNLENKYGTTAEHTMCYRVDGNENSVKTDFFIEGNKKTAHITFAERATK